MRLKKVQLPEDQNVKIP